MASLGQHTNKDGRNSTRSSPSMKRYRRSMAVERGRTIFSRDKIPPRSRPGQTQSVLPQSLGVHTSIGPVVFTRPSFLCILHPSGSSNLSGGFSEPEGEGPDEDLTFRTENSKVSNSPHTAHLWLSVFVSINSSKELFQQRLKKTLINSQTKNTLTCIDDGRELRHNAAKLNFLKWLL